MSQKVLQQFSAKIVKAKNQYESTRHQCEGLRKEAARLQREYDELVARRKDAEAAEEELKNQYLTTKKENQIENDKCSKQLSELNSLRKTKKQLKRMKDVYEAELLKQTLGLEELVKQRVSLEQNAKSLSEKLQNITVEKNALQSEYQRTNKAIEEYSQRIRELKADMETMRQLISNSCQPSP